MLLLKQRCINTPPCHRRAHRSSMNEMSELAVTLNAIQYSRVFSFPPLLLSLLRLAALLSWVGGLQQQQLSKGGPQTYQITLTPPPRGAFKQIIRSFLGHHHVQQAARRSTETPQNCSFAVLCTTGKKARRAEHGDDGRRACTCSDCSLTCSAPVMSDRDTVLNM